jgi:hypothetical protein
MNSRPLYLLSPYRPPTSYPVTLADGEAAAWLNGYFALWHPDVLRHAVGPAEAVSSYDHDLPKPGAIYAIPEGPSLFQPDGWAEQAKAAGAVAFVSTADRTETQANLEAALRESGVEVRDVSPDVATTFAGVGLGYLTLETWFDAADHEHLLDRDGFWADVTTAAKAEDAREQRNALKSAAEKLQSAREVLHSGSVRLLDFVSLGGDGPTPPWPGTLAAGLPLNVVANSARLAKLKEDEPERFAELMAKCPPGLAASVEFCVGGRVERDDATLPVESQLFNLVEGRLEAEAITGQPVNVYARHAGASHPHLPGWLHHAGYQSLVAASLDGVTSSHQRAPAIHWPGPDGRALDAFAKDFLAAHEAQTYFNLAYYLHQAANGESQPALAFRHAGPAGVGYGELLALTELSNALGEWSGVGRYLTDIGPGDYSGPATADDYPADPLDERVTNRKRPDPVSGFANQLRLRRRVDGTYALAALNRSFAVPDAAELDDLATLARIESIMEGAGADIHGEPAGLVSVERAVADRLVARLSARGEADKPGYYVLNPCAFTRRVALELEPFPGPIPVEGVVKAAQFDADKTRLVVEVPPLGFAWLPRTGHAAAPKTKVKSAEGTTLRNEFFEAEFDPATGGIKAFRDLRTRSNRMAVVPVFNPGCKTRGTSITVTNAGTALGEVVSEGELVSEVDEPLATFRIRARAWVGRPVLELRAEFTRTHDPAGYPWHAYFGLRFGTRDDRVALFRGLNGTSYQAGTGRVVSPDFFEFRFGRERSFVFPGGLPFVSKHGPRTYDLILNPPGETETAFDLLLALDRDHPSQTAAGWVAPAPVVATDRGPPPVGPSGWLAHLDMPSLMMTDFRPVPSSGDGMTRAVAARFLETAGYGGAAELKFARDPARAFRVNGTGETDHELTLAGDAVPLDFSGGELLRVRAEW